MAPVLVFFGVAVLVGCTIRWGVGRRRRVVARQPDASEADLCQLDQASRISSVALVVSLAGLAVAVAASAIVWLA